MIDSTEKLIKTIKDCGQSVIDNAESIAGDYKLQTRLTITIDIAMDGFPSIDAKTEWLPESLISSPDTDGPWRCVIECSEEPV